MNHPHFDISARWDKEPEQRALEAYQQWHRENCPLMYRESDESRLNPVFLKACNSWKKGITGLGLFGATGSTKTRCMWQLLRRIAKPWPHLQVFKGGGYHLRWSYEVHYYWHSVSIVRDVDFARECASQFKDGHNGKKLESWRTCDVLFIDDLGKSRITERVQTELFDLVDFRTSRGLPILWTSNYDAKGLIRRFASPDDAGPIIRRLVESCEIVTANP